MNYMEDKLMTAVIACFTAGVVFGVCMGLLIGIML